VRRLLRTDVQAAMMDLEPPGSLRVTVIDPLEAVGGW
jgi:hypothetical protein